MPAPYQVLVIYMIICLIGGSQFDSLLCTYAKMIVWQPHSIMHAAADISLCTVTACEC